METSKVDLASLAEALQGIAESSKDYASCALKASAAYPTIAPELLRAAVEIACGRVRIAGECPQLRNGFFTKKGLQQRTHPVIAAHHGSFFTGCTHVLEVCTGLGFDSVALAQQARGVTSLECDPLTALCARKNVELLGVSNIDILQQSLEVFLSENPRLALDGIWADPDRRPEVGRRVRDVAQYEPSLDLLFSLKNTGPFCIKISPAAHLETLPDGWTRQWVGFQGECKEQLLLRVPGKDAPSVFIADDSAEWSAHQERVCRYAPLPEAGLIYLHEPHPALVASSLLDSYCGEQGITRWDADVVYGYSQSPIPLSPFIESFSLLFIAPYDRKKLRQTLFDLQWDTRTEIKKRAFPEEPDVVRKQLKLIPYKKEGTDCGVVFLTRAGKKLIMALGKRLRG